MLSAIIIFLQESKIFWNPTKEKSVLDIEKFQENHVILCKVLFIENEFQKHLKR